MNKTILNSTNNLNILDSKRFMILTILIIIFGVSKTEKVQASNFYLKQEGFPNNGKIIGFFSGKDNNNNGFLSENEIQFSSFEYVSGENVPNFLLENSQNLEFSYNLLTNELNSVNVQGFLQNPSGEFGYFYNKDGRPSSGNSLGLVFTGGPSPNTQDVSFELAVVTSVPEPSSTLSLLALGTLGAASTLKHKLKPSKKDKTKVS
ncbi:PEP-CTERM sorting domain-containing protein [Crocosphaera sp. XPORK-15E]|uniref:PEP-CTERM sorting domain-containing protein n=1 Tax=Crocosphaera sp. XPORK-15E TaxID=3110247 RepID=UPI002B2170E7|nr:PEP-CTERM sorting domain-containing protein [Crocosphaera sp. XPORK-15E]MEA5536824.1 PEP-CTERM sorting domain-containing protein [Crocosphaera sp. XPORK-15E]